MSGLSTEQERHTKELIAREQKIAAIKLFREVTGASLKDAKDAVDDIELGTTINFPTPTQAGEPNTFFENRIKRLLAERKNIEAVKVYREAHSCGLKEAKDAVDAIEMQMRAGGYSSLPSAPPISNVPFAEDTQRNRSFLALVVAIVIVVISGALFFSLTGNGF